MIPPNLGQTRALLERTAHLPAQKKATFVLDGAGHYGLFNGSRFRTGVLPQLDAFQHRHETARPPASTAGRQPAR